MRTRRDACLSAALAVACCWLCGADVAAETFPARTVTFVVPSPAGGSPDRMIRMVGDRLSTIWGVPVITENRPGGTGVVGAEAVARSQPNGYKILFAFTALVQAPVVFPKVSYDLERDLLPVSLAAYAPAMLIVANESPFRALGDLLATAKNPATSVTYGTFGAGSSYHIYGETLRLAADVHLSHIPFKGEALALNDVLGGHIQSSFISVGAGAPHVRAGKIRPLAIVARTRSPVLPEVPTFAELGFPGLDAVGWFGALVPVGTPRDVVVKLSDDINRALGEPGLSATLRNMGIEPVGTTPEEFREFLRVEGGKWKRMIQTSGIGMAN